MAKEIRVLIVEDVAEMRSLLQNLIEGIPGFRVSGLAKNAWEARLELERRRPDLVLLDEVLPGESSLDLLAELVDRDLPTFLISGLEEPTHPLPEGASGRLRKPSWQSLDDDRSRFAAAIRQGLG